MIYFLRAEQTNDRVEAGWIKIGTTIRLSVRLKQIANDIGHTPTVLGVLNGGYSEERALHMRFAMVRVIGEWFAPCPALKEIVRDETRIWDGRDDIETAIIKLHHDVVTSAKIVAAYRGVSVTDLLDSILLPILLRMEKEIISERSKELESLIANDGYIDEPELRADHHVA